MNETGLRRSSRLQNKKGSKLSTLTIDLFSKNWFQQRNYLRRKEKHFNTDNTNSSSSPIHPEISRSTRVLKCVHHDPNIFIIDNFLTEKEVDHLLKISRKNSCKFETSYTQATADEQIYSQERTSTFIFLQKYMDRITFAIESRAADIINIPIGNVEPLQIVRYTEGQEFKLHHDAGTLINETVKKASSSSLWSLVSNTKSHNTSNSDSGSNELNLKPTKSLNKHYSNHSNHSNSNSNHSNSNSNSNLQPHKLPSLESHYSHARSFQSNINQSSHNNNVPQFNYSSSMPSPQFNNNNNNNQQININLIANGNNNNNNNVNLNDMNLTTFGNMNAKQYSKYRQAYQQHIHKQRVIAIQRAQMMEKTSPHHKNNNLNVNMNKHTKHNANNLNMHNNNNNNSIISDDDNDDNDDDSAMINNRADISDDEDDDYDEKERNADYSVEVVPPYRVCSFFVYLTTLSEGNGGETYFPKIGLKVRPERGKAVLWCNVDPNDSHKPDPMLIHRACPVTGVNVEKIGMNIWINDSPIAHNGTNN